MSAQPHAFSALGRALVQNGRLQQADANAIQEEARKTSVPFIQALVLSRKLSAKEVSQFAAETFGYPLLDLSTFSIESLPEAAIDAKLMAAQRVVALAKRGNKLSVALSDGRRLKARTVVAASGARYRRPAVPRLGDFEGRGVWYWASAIEARMCAHAEVARKNAPQTYGQSGRATAPARNTATPISVSRTL